MDWLKGKRTIIGSTLMSILGAIATLDMANDGTLNWMKPEMYVAIGTIIAGLTGVAMRLSIANTTKSLLLLCMVLPICGCSMFDPGGQTATALKQDTKFGWDANSNFTAGLVGSQTGAFTMAEGELVLDENGNVDPEQSRIQSYLTYTPKADDAATALDRAYAQSTQQQQQMLQTLQAMVGMVMLSRMPQQPAGESDNGSGALMQGLLQQFLQPSTPTTPAPGSGGGSVKQRPKAGSQSSTRPARRTVKRPSRALASNERKNGS